MFVLVVGFKNEYIYLCQALTGALQQPPLQSRLHQEQAAPEPTSKRPREKDVSTFTPYIFTHLQRLTYIMQTIDVYIGWITQGKDAKRKDFALKKLLKCLDTEEAKTELRDLCNIIGESHEDPECNAMLLQVIFV